MLKRLNVSILVLALAFVAVSCANDKDQEVREAAVTAVTPQATQPAATAANPNMVTPDQVTVPDGPTTAMTFGEMTYDFGTITAGEKVRHVYSFTNTGDEPLVISNARGSCGCTVPQWPQEAIAPGEDGEIVVEYNSKGKSGKETKTVTITANTMPAVTKLTITGTVNPGAAAGSEVQIVQ